MDENKLQRLHDVDYEVRRVCGNCEYGLGQRDGIFGECRLISYQHLKHTGVERGLSVHRYGTCQHHHLDEQFTARIHRYAELIEPARVKDV